MKIVITVLEWVNRMGWGEDGWEERWSESCNSWEEAFLACIKNGMPAEYKQPTERIERDGVVYITVYDENR